MKPVIITDGFLNDKKRALSCHVKVRSELHAKISSHPESAWTKIRLALQFHCIPSAAVFIQNRWIV